ncbi:MAG: spore maturation protein CgeB [Candidatus Paceibacteria bacterium]|jgi:spore maturation protein CgeB
MTASPLAQALGYSKFQAGAKPRMMVMKSKYFIVEDVVSIARELDWAVQELPTKLGEKGESSYIKSMLMALVDFRPDFLLTINHIGFDSEGVLAGLLEDFGIPLASWFVDHPLPILAGAEANARGTSQVFCFEKTALGWLESIGFENPVHLPTASNPDTFYPSRVDIKRVAQLGSPVSLVAGSWWEKANTSFSPEVHQLAKEMSAKGPIDSQFLRNHMGAYLAQADDNARTHCLAAQAALAESSMRKRRDFVLALAEHSPVVNGDEHWSKLVQGVELRGPLHPTQDLPTVFGSSKVNLNVTAEQMPTAVNQRVWDVPGTGGFLLTDAQDDVLENFTDGEDVAVYHSLDEARDKLAYYLTHDAEREAIARKGLATVDAKHRTHHRLRQMEDVMRCRFGSGY